MKARNKPGPNPMDPTIRLRDAAIEYAMAIEVYGDETAERYTRQRQVYWDRLRKAAIAYRVEPHTRGRPKCSTDRVPRRKPTPRSVG